jgi:hypothetical protein
MEYAMPRNPLDLFTRKSIDRKRNAMRKRPDPQVRAARRSLAEKRAAFTRMTHLFD